MDSYSLFQALHIIAMVAWFAGLFYLPRLYVYHANATPGGELDQTLQVMERKLLRFIMNPAMILTFIFGIIMIKLYPEIVQQGWLHVKITLAVALAGYQGYLGVIRKRFANQSNAKTHVYYRWLNEVPTVALIVMVLLAVLKPF